MQNLRRQAGVPGTFRQALAAVNGILQKVPKQGGQVKLRNRQGFRQPNLPIRFYPSTMRHFMVVAKQGVQRSIAAVIPRLCPCKLAAVFCKVHLDVPDVPLLGKGGKKPQGMAEIMAQPCSLLHMHLQRAVLARFQFQQPGTLLQFGVVQD